MAKSPSTEQKHIYLDSLQVIFNLQNYHFKSGELKTRYNNLIYNNFKELFYKQRNTTG